MRKFFYLDYHFKCEKVVSFLQCILRETYVLKNSNIYITIFKQYPTRPIHSHIYYYMHVKLDISVKMRGSLV